MVLLSESGPSLVPFISFPLSGPRGLGEPGGSPERPGGLEVVAEAPCVPMCGKDRVKDPGWSPWLLSLVFSAPVP